MILIKKVIPLWQILLRLINSPWIVVSFCSYSSSNPYFMFFCSRVLGRSTMVVLEFALGTIRAKRPWLGLHHMVIRAWIQRGVQNYVHQLGAVPSFSFLSFPGKKWETDFHLILVCLCVFELVLHLPSISLSFCWGVDLVIIWVWVVLHDIHSTTGKLWVWSKRNSVG